MSDPTIRCDVAIVGCGTTGLSLARLLQYENVSVAVIDRSRIPLSFPRATHLDDETMRTFQTLGVQQLEKEFTHQGNYRFYDSEWRVANEFRWASGVTEQGWVADYQFHQPDWEAVLRGLTHEHPGTATFYGWTVSDLQDSGDAVTVAIREVSSGLERSIEARFVVGSDGANSPVRKMIGASQVDHHATHRSLIVDIYPLVDDHGLAGSTDAFIQGGIRNPLTVLATQHPRLRIEEMLRADDDAHEFERPEHAYDLISRWLAPHEYRVLRSDVYEWRSLTADPWRVGRVFLAGDAAHTMPPHLGQGMCSGVRDSANLAWKLGRVLREESPVELLDTYESERRPHVEVFTTLAAQLANSVEAMEVVADPAADHPVTEVAALRPRLGSGARAGDADATAGILSAQPTLDDGQRLDDRVGYRFALLGDPATLSGVSAGTSEALESLGVVVLTQEAGELRNWVGGLGVKAVLVRPDRYIFGSASSPAEVDGLVSGLATHLKAPVAPA
jgi:3-(3-hydroxy-phenyl)propionate hydroxylase